MKKLNKKILLGSTALVSAALFATAAQAVDVKVGGFARFQAGWFDDAFKDTTNRDFQMESEIHVNAKGVTENGLEYGAKVQLRASTDDSLASDEVTIWLESRWGRVELGDQDGAADVMAYYAPKIGWGQAVDSDADDWLDGSSKAQIGPKALDTADSTKISYFTPRFYGVQLGASYAPELDEGENIVRSSKAPSAGVANNAVAGGNTFNAQPATANAARIDYVDPRHANRGDAEAYFKGAYEDLFELGANFITKFDEIDFALAAGYTHGDFKSADFKRRAINAWHLGAQAGWNGFKLGGSYVNNDDSGQLKAYKKQDRYSWNVGLSYENGPWGVGLNYIKEDYDGKDGMGNYYAYGIGGQYRLAPGLMVAADWVYHRRNYGEQAIGDVTPGAKIVPTDGGAVSLLKDGKTRDLGHVFVIGTQLDF